MDDRELDAKLHQGRREAEKFFSGLFITPLRELVYRRIKTGRSRKLSFNRAVVGLLAAVVVLLVILNLGRGANPVEMGVRVAQQRVILNNKENTHWVNYFRVTQPDSLRENLLVVLWAPQKDGGWEPVYSSLLEGGGVPLPISTMELPGERRQLIIISSRDREDRFFHYRLLAYDDGEVLPYHEEDNVPRGQLEVGPGFLVERRTVPLSFSPGEDFPPTNDGALREVTYLIPYYINAKGEIVVPQGPLSLRVGQYLVLVGNDGGVGINAAAWGAITPVNKGFYASALGDGYLILTPNDDPDRRVRLTFEVQDPGK
ncbi:MAG: hypothetical protein GX376_04170 [Firmicutes bacterium]|nr:hypothetical protein [Bacillota bacterium]